MKLIFFRKQRERTEPPGHIQLPLLTGDNQYRVLVTNTLRYLSFFFDTKLSWSHQVEIMCNQAQGTLKALKLLGNSVRGQDQAQWRLAYNAICLLVLTYGCQLWFRGKEVTLVKKLHQNQVVRLISRTFRTTPCNPLHQLLNILPGAASCPQTTTMSKVPTPKKIPPTLQQVDHILQSVMAHTQQLIADDPRHFATPPPL